MDTDIRKVVKQIQDFYRKNQRPPTYEEMAEMFGFASTNASYKLVQKLIRLDIFGERCIREISPQKPIQNSDD